MASVLARMKKYDKLVRDGIPKIIEEARKRAIWRELSDEEFREALKTKVLEEAGELLEASDDSLLSELADLSDIIDAILLAYDLSREDLETLRQKKREERGGFARKIFLESVSE